MLECLPPGDPTESGAGRSTGVFDPTPQVSYLNFDRNAGGNGWWIVIIVLAWIAMILGVNEYITRLWERPKMGMGMGVGVGAGAPPAEADNLLP
jgi:hypothetical protein